MDVKRYQREVKMSEKTKNGQIESMDMAKLVVAISIVAMHTSLFTGTQFQLLFGHRHEFQSRSSFLSWAY